MRLAYDVHSRALRDNVIRSVAPQCQQTKHQSQLVIQLQPYTTHPGRLPNTKCHSCSGQPPLCTHPRLHMASKLLITYLVPSASCVLARLASWKAQDASALVLGQARSHTKQETTEPPPHYLANHNDGWLCLCALLLGPDFLNCRLAACCCLVHSLLGLVCGPVDATLDVVSTTRNTVGGVLGNILRRTCV